MPAETPPKREPKEPKEKKQEEFDPTREFPGPPEEEFWEKHNKRLEFPLGAMGAVLFHVIVGVLLVFALNYMANGPDRSGVPVVLAEGGFDDTGAGSAGSGGQEDPIEDKKTLQERLQEITDPATLPELTKNLQKIIDLPDTPIAQENAANFSKVDKELLQKLMGSNKKGAGPGTGSGFDGTAGSGPGGSGADSTRARSLRWVLRFRTANGGDYVNQLAAMNALVLIPIPPENKDCLIVENLRSPKARKATEDDLKRLASQIKFSDTREQSVRSVTSELGQGELRAKSFWAFFPRGLEDELSRKETGYKGKRAEDIEETIFTVRVTGGGYELVVVEQKLKK